MPDYSSFFTGGQPAAGQDGGPPTATPAPEAGPRPYRILLVDDEPNVLAALRRVFRQENYQMDTAADAREALELMARARPQLVISDHKMPGMTGAELLARIRDQYPDTIRIMLTGYADTAAVMGAIRDGAVYRFILKPWNDDDLRVTVALALEQYDLIQKNLRLQEQSRSQSKEIQALSRLATASRSRLPALLQKHGVISEAQVQELQRLQPLRKVPMIRLILDRKLTTESRIRELLRKEMTIDEVSLPEFQVDPTATELIPASFCERQWVLPLKLKDKRRLLLAMADPTDQELLQDLHFISGLEIQPVLARITDLTSKIPAIYGEGRDAAAGSDFTALVSTDPMDAIEVMIDEEEDGIPVEELLRSTEEPPAIRLVNAILLEAMRLGVSDVHIQPRIKGVVVRYRIDGILTDKIYIPHELHRALISRIKVMAEMDIAERRRSQDGRITVKTPMKIVDMRISTLPTLNGEKIVLRLLDRNANVQGVADLGFSPGNLDRVLNLVARPQGIILATGPTGSGKTTTLYSLMQHQATSGKNYVTIEDPVEFTMDMASQVPVKDKIGVDFAAILRAILRQDPDVILLGEIRDRETAQVAFHAALTGHLVYSTLHTNSAVETIARLVDMELRPYIIASALAGVIAQRLVRRICDHCREEIKPEPEVMRRLGPRFTRGLTHTSHGRGCTRCNHSGFKGRLPVHEVFAPSDNVRDLIASGRGMMEIRRAAEKEHFTTLLDDARDKVNQGLTPVEEVLRVLGPQG